MCRRLLGRVGEWAHPGACVVRDQREGVTADHLFGGAKGGACSEELRFCCV